MTGSIFAGVRSQTGMFDRWSLAKDGQKYDVIAKSKQSPPLRHGRFGLIALLFTCDIDQSQTLLSDESLFTNPATQSSESMSWEHRSPSAKLDTASSCSSYSSTVGQAAFR